MNSYLPLLIFSGLLSLVSLRAGAQELVANISRDSEGSEIRHLQQNGDWLIYFAHDGTNGAELYVVAEPGAAPRRFPVSFENADAFIGQVHLAGDRVFYTAQEPTDGAAGPIVRLYAADLAAGTRTLLLDDNDDRFPSPFFRGAETIDGVTYLFFTGTGLSVWTTDGTAAGTRPAFRRPGFSSSRPVVTDSLFFWTTDNRTLYRSDGTDAGTFPVAISFNDRPTLSNPTAFGSKIYFYNRTESRGLQGFVNDGSRSSTRLLSEALPGFPGGFPQNFGVSDGRLYFSIDEPDGSSLVYRTDGETAERYLDLPADPLDRGFAQPVYGTPYTYFFRVDTFNQHSVWRTDGTPDATVKLDKVFLERDNQRTLGAGAIRGRDGAFFFIGEKPGTGAEYLVATNAPERIDLVTDLYPGPVSSNPGLPVRFGNHIYFPATAPGTGEELYHLNTDAATYAIELTTDLNTTEAGSFPTRFAAVNGRLVFEAGTSCTGREPHYSDGTGGGTGLLADIYAGGRGLGRFAAVRLGTDLYFTGEPGVFERDVYRTNGTTGGTRRVTALNPDADSLTEYVYVLPFKDRLLLLGQMAGVAGRPVFLSYSPVTETVDTLLTLPRETFVIRGVSAVVLNDSTALLQTNSRPDNRVYVTDGTPGGTRELFNAGESILLRFRVFDGVAYYVQKTALGDELHRTDGTPEGTYRITDVNPGPGGSLIGDVLAFGDHIYFAATDESFGIRTLYRTNGERNNWELIPGPVGRLRFPELSAIGNRLIIRASEGRDAEDTELFVLEDGQARATLLRDINPGPASGSPLGFSPLGDYLYFSADDGTNGRELWRTDGTPDGTTLVADINPGPGDSDPQGLYDWNGVLYFGADDGLSGNELWRYDPANPDGADPENDPNAVADFCTTVSTHEPPLNADVLLWPNPAAETAMLAVEATDRFSASVYDAGGRRLFTVGGEGGYAELPVCTLPAGTYAVRVADPAGRVAVRSFVVAR